MPNQESYNDQSGTLKLLVCKGTVPTPHISSNLCCPRLLIKVVWISYHSLPPQTTNHQRLAHSPRSPYNSLPYPFTNKLVPPISSGCDRPMTSSTVGATSPNTPSCFFRLQPSGALAMTKGTLFVVCDVFGFPCSLSISSALLCWKRR